MMVIPFPERGLKMAKDKILQTDVRLNTHQFLVDTAIDLNDLPKETGSVALVANTGEVYICNNAKEWVKL